MHQLRHNNKTLKKLIDDKNKTIIDLENQIKKEEQENKDRWSKLNEKLWVAHD